MVDPLVFITGAFVLGFAAGGAIVWFGGDSKSYAKGFEAGYQHAMTDVNDVVVRVRKEVFR